MNVYAVQVDVRVVVVRLWWYLSGIWRIESVVAFFVVVVDLQLIYVVVGRCLIYFHLSVVGVVEIESMYYLKCKVALSSKYFARCVNAEIICF